ncbi:MAG: hypothetical protein RIR70_1931 [Pseudomonadota bacterium]
MTSLSPLTRTTATLDSLIDRYGAEIDTNHNGLIARDEVQTALTRKDFGTDQGATTIAASMVQNPNFDWSFMARYKSLLSEANGGAETRVISDSAKHSSYGLEVTDKAPTSKQDAPSARTREPKASAESGARDPWRFSESDSWCGLQSALQGAGSATMSTYDTGKPELAARKREIARIGEELGESPARIATLVTLLMIETDDGVTKTDYSNGNVGVMNLQRHGFMNIANELNAKGAHINTNNPSFNDEVTVAFTMLESYGAIGNQLPASIRPTSFEAFLAGHRAGAMGLHDIADNGVANTKHPEHNWGEWVREVPKMINQVLNNPGLLEGTQRLAFAPGPEVG